VKLITILRLVPMNEWSYTSIPASMLSWYAHSINVYAHLTVMNVCDLLASSSS